MPLPTALLKPAPMPISASDTSSPTTTTDTKKREPQTSTAAAKARTPYAAAQTPEYAEFAFGSAFDRERDRDHGVPVPVRGPVASSSSSRSSAFPSSSSSSPSSSSSSSEASLASSSSSSSVASAAHFHLHSHSHLHPYPPPKTSDPKHPQSTHPHTQTEEYDNLQLPSSSSSLKNRLRKWHSKTSMLLKANTGLLLVTGAQVFLSLMNVAVKTLNGVDPPVPTLELVAVRMIITYICCMAYMLSTGVPDPYFGPKGVRLLLVTRGAVGFFGLFGVYYSLQYLSLSDATVLTFLAPMCTAIAGALLLGEKFTRREALAGFVSLIGVVLIARPAAIFGERMAQAPAGAGAGIDGTPDADVPAAEKGTPQERLVAVGVALIGVLGATGAYTSIRAIGKRAHPLHSMTFFSVLCVMISSTAMVVNKTPVVVPTRLEWLALLLMIGIFGFLAQTLLTMGLQRETAGRGSMAVYTQIVFATILERIFFHAVPTALSVIGTMLIISSALYVALTKEKEAGEEYKAVSVQMRRVGRTSRDAELEEGLLASSERELGEREGKGSLDKEARD